MTCDLEKILDRPVGLVPEKAEKGTIWKTQTSSTIGHYRFGKSKKTGLPAAATVTVS
jgi:hypothetical protein